MGALARVGQPGREGIDIRYGNSKSTGPWEVVDILYATFQVDYLKDGASNGDVTGRPIDIRYWTSKLLRVS